jgi:hypothetical protein
MEREKYACMRDAVASVGRFWLTSGFWVCTIYLGYDQFFFTDNNSLRNDVWNLAIIFGDDEKCGDNHFLQSYKLPSSSWKTRNMMINHTKRLKFTWTVRGDEKKCQWKKTVPKCIISPRIPRLHMENPMVSHQWSEHGGFSTSKIL